MNIIELLHELSDATGDEWLEANLELWSLGYSWELHADGTYLLKDRDNG